MDLARLLLLRRKGNRDYAIEIARTLLPQSGAHAESERESESRLTMFEAKEQFRWLADLLPHGSHLGVQEVARRKDPVRRDEVLEGFRHPFRQKDVVFTDDGEAAPRWAVFAMPVRAARGT